MDIQIMKEIFQKNKIVQLIFIFFIIVILFFYFKIFFRTGVYFENTFLKEITEPSATYYVGRSIYGNIEITIKGVKNLDNRADVIYELPNNIYKRYTVTYEDPKDWEKGIKNIKDKDGNILFKGEYGNDDFILLDENGELVENAVSYRIGNQNPFDSSYEVRLQNVADFAIFSNVTIWGNYEYLIYAVMLFILFGIDRTFPLLFFKLKYFLSVNEPEPSDFYLAMQRLAWFVYPILGVIFMFIAIIKLD